MDEFGTEGGAAGRAVGGGGWAAWSRGGGKEPAAPGGVRVRARRCRRCARRSRRGWWCARAWCLRSAVGVPARADARANRGVDVHGAPLGSIITPWPAATLLRVFIFRSSAVRLMVPADQPPCGSMPVPSPAATPLWMVMVRSFRFRVVSREDRCPDRRRRRSSSASSSAAVGVHGAAAFAAGADACRGVHPPPPPLGSIAPPLSPPARIPVVVFIAAFRRWGRCIRRRWRGAAYGRSSRSAAVRVHEGAVAGAELRPGAHRGPPPLGSTYPPSPARNCVRVLIATVRRAGPIQSPRRRGSVCWSSWSFLGHQG